MTRVGVVTSGILLIVANVVGYAGAMRRARLQRQQFLLLEQEQRSTQRLLDEVARREALEKRLLHIAQTDELTGLSTRRHFMESAHQAFVAARQQGRPFSLCMIDIDNFKMINDRWGHGSGDRVLKEVADACRQTLRAEEPVGRFGGEEFVAALPDADRSDARHIAERLRERVADLRFDGDLADLRVTMTIGLSEVHPSELDLELALKRADAALYQGKRSGRDIVLGDDLEGYAPSREAGLGSRV
jgi:diguanylate cyclase (GGDEF)-like protein